MTEIKRNDTHCCSIGRSKQQTGWSAGWMREITVADRPTVRLADRASDGLSVGWSEHRDSSELNRLKWHYDDLFATAAAAAIASERHQSMEENDKLFFSLFSFGDIFRYGWYRRGPQRR